MATYRSIKIACIAAACIGAALLYLAAGILFYNGNGPAVRADAAIVLGAASWGDKPSPVFRERINYAVRLYKSGMVKKILFTGARDSEDEPPASAVAKRYAADQGVPEADCLEEARSRTTEENLYYARELARGNGLATFLVVSDPLHMKRAMTLARDLGMDARPAPTPTTRYRSFGSSARFLFREMYYSVSYHIKKIVTGTTGGRSA